jgi:hypothetical protein
MGLNEIQKQTIAQRLRDGTSIRAIAAEVGVDKWTVLLTKQKVKPIHNLYLKSDVYTTQIFNFWICCSVICVRVFFWPAIVLWRPKNFSRQFVTLKKKL